MHLLCVRACVCVCVCVCACVRVQYPSTLRTRFQKSDRESTLWIPRGQCTMYHEITRSSLETTPPSRLSRALTFVPVSAGHAGSAVGSGGSHVASLPGGPLFPRLACKTVRDSVTHNATSVCHTTARLAHTMASLCVTPL